MTFIKKGTIPSKTEFDMLWDQHLPNKHYLQFNDSRVGACSIPREQVYEELHYAYLDWLNCTSESLEAYNWMCHILYLLNVDWIS